MGFLRLFFVLLIIGLSTQFLAADPTCYNTGNFTSNSTYGQNRREVLSSILAGVADGKSFVQATTGVDSDQVYSFAMCRGDISPNACYTCVNESIYQITNACPVQREAINWGLELHCIVRCLDHSLPDSYETNPYVFLYNVNHVSINLDQFDQDFTNLTSTIITRASSGSTVKFAAGDLDLDHFDKLYALVQCIPNLSVADCVACLQTAVGNFERQLPGQQGGVFLTPSCIFRYESYLFYNITEVDWDSSPPPPFVSSAPSSPAIKIDAGGGGRNSRPPIIMIVIPIVIISILAALTCLFVRNRWLAYIVWKKPFEDEAVESLHFDFTTIKVATSDFCEFNKLGEGGFGAVYKGTLSDGQDVAVKRLASGSSQGELEFKNEVLLMARLEHKNLVRLIGFCLEGIERILIYEFVPNASLDHFLFDPIRRVHMNWKMRYNIIRGIARGLLYLHEESRLKIIHRDLKASNILLDECMNPKISDFGMARLFIADQSHSSTRRIVGTYGYMAPEYAKFGTISVKADVFSFGVLLLEIISGRKNATVKSSGHVEHLLSYAWKHWTEGRVLKIIDRVLRDHGRLDEMKLYIHIGLLCVQERARDRPTMAAVNLMLNSFSQSLPPPSEPAFLMEVSHSTNPTDPVIKKHSRPRGSHPMGRSINS